MPETETLTTRQSSRNVVNGTFFGLYAIWHTRDFAMPKNERRGTDDTGESVRGLSEALADEFGEDAEEIERQAREFDIEDPEDAHVERVDE